MIRLQRVDVSGGHAKLNERTIVAAHPNRSLRRPARPGTGLARVLSKLGFCSRSQATALIAAGRVRVNGKVRRELEWSVDLNRDQVAVDGRLLRPASRLYLALNKPRGLVTTASDEQGRATVFECFAGASLPFIAPVGRLDQASEGLLLFTNDTDWAARITDPASQLEKTYHVQVSCVAGAALVQRMQQGVNVAGDFLAARRVRLLRHGTCNSWLEVVLHEGKNRHIRRLLAALGVEVLRLVRVAIGPLTLGNLPKGRFRFLTDAEVERLKCSLVQPSTLNFQPATVPTGSATPRPGPIARQSSHHGPVPAPANKSPKSAPSAAVSFR
jgi:23S rRNA pseudouridine2605 synthase